MGEGGSECWSTEISCVGEGRGGLKFSQLKFWDGGGSELWSTKI